MQGARTAAAQTENLKFSRALLPPKNLAKACFPKSWAAHPRTEYAPMVSPAQASLLSADSSGGVIRIEEPKLRVRFIQLDILRGVLLVWMTLTHLPTRVSIVSNQTLGFVSGAEGFIFLSAFIIGQLETRKEQRYGPAATLRDLFRRTVRIYLYHCALLAIAFTLVAQIGVTFHRVAIQNLLSFFLQSPRAAVVSALLLEYRPSLLDILPMYIVFMLLTPVARAIAKRWGWDVVIYLSLAVWCAGQFGIRGWLYRHTNLFGIAIPESSTGAFDLYGWQLLWIVALALGAMYADALAASSNGHKSEMTVPKWLVRVSIVVATVFLILRYSPADHWINPDLYGWLVDKWHLGPARVINFAALAIVLTRFGPRIAALPFMLPFAELGQASIEVFSVHVLCCLAGNALSRDADPNLPLWQQALLLPITLAALFLTAHIHRWYKAREANLANVSR